jgi:hypothetical protein
MNICWQQKKGPKRAGFVVIATSLTGERMQMNILVFYDGSPQSRRAFETGINMGKNFNAELHLVFSNTL